MTARSLTLRRLFDPEALLVPRVAAVAFCLSILSDLLSHCVCFIDVLVVCLCLLVVSQYVACVCFTGVFN